ncbi:SGNH/GDSL hydrolase family protein [Streptomyces sp. NPDC058000]|uniref:SGNH/GDSL hydrolase family protein n=1 Tax=Streptomyces sp. NPDC058000 TaxID=3346299 RepID=UPI0036ED3B2E
MRNPDKVLGPGWKSSRDQAVIGAADTNGYKILVAHSGEAYDWNTAATLAERGMPTDSWIGNQCTMDADHVAAVYAPRTFMNKPDLMQGGAFTAIVNIKTGTVTKLPFTASLAYFDPTCNPETHTAAFTAFRGMNDIKGMHTRLVTVNVNGRTTGEVTTDGEVTSAVPVADGTVAARGNRLIHLDRSGKAKTLTSAGGVPFDLRPTQGAGVAFIERDGDKTAHAKVWKGTGSPATVATGRLGDLALAQGASRVFLTGHPTGKTSTTDTGVTPLNAPATSGISSQGRLAVTPVLSPGVKAGLERIANAGKGFTKESSARDKAPKDAGPINQFLTVTSTATTTGTTVTQAVTQKPASVSASRPSPALATTGKKPRAPVTAGVSHDPTDPDRHCAISRNDVHSQALQPTPNQVEWAVGMAVRGNLRAGYLTQTGYRSQIGIGTIDPQGMFPPPTLKGGGRVPANVLLGVLAQESNLWQAEQGTVPGQMGSPLAAMDGYYGRKASKDDPNAYWKIHWDDSDCGYGVGQVTDGMRLNGFEKTDPYGNKIPNLPPEKQKAVAVDYATNIAAAVQILADKWNEVHTDGQNITVNNDDPSRVENWFTAIWNYNLGFNAPADAGANHGHWGLGWYNNPANPVYAKGWGHPFMDTDVDGAEAIKDAAHPQDWPYEEKVMGWSAWSIDTGFSYATSGRQDWPGESGYATAGFYPAWWTTTTARSAVSPPLSAFCNTNNNCDPGTPPDCPNKECYEQYWWHQANVTWKPDCATTCGNEHIKYQTPIAEPGRGYRLQYGQPLCGGAPTGAHVVASVPDGTPTWGDCGQIASSGSFQFNFYPDSDNQYEAKEDLYQIGGGYGGHFWYAHTRDKDHLGGEGGPMAIEGTWTDPAALGWARVLVHLPDTGAQTRQAKYRVLNTDSKSAERAVEQRAGRWVSLGVFHFIGTPKVTLSNVTADGTADEDIAWGAVAFQPLSGKPKNVVVAMGDSYSSGEGASEGNRDYYPETNYRNKNDEKSRDACHRSRYAWSRLATLPGESQPVGYLDDNWDVNLDYHLIACSGARTYNVLSKIQKNGGELPQLQQGYLDDNTTLVTISIGGNDARFSDIITKCLVSFGDGNCKDKTFEKPDDDVGGRDRKFLGQPLEVATPGIINEIVRPDITQTLYQVHALAPHAKIVLMGYPPLISDKGSCLNLSIIGLPTIGLTEDSTAWLNSTADTLAGAMQGAAEDAKQQGVPVWFSNPKNDFDGKAVCGNPEQVHGIVKTLTTSDDPIVDLPLLNKYGPSAQSFHPKIGGASLYANSLQRTMAGMGL